MQCNWNSDLPWLSGGEQDFPLGAKATSCLPSATDLDHDYNSNNFELPEWMESRENLGLSNIDLFDDVKFPVKMEHDIVYRVNGMTELEDDYSQTMKPEDMLVPLSELQPETYTPQGIGANTLSAVPSIPKVSIRVSKVAIPEPENHTMCSTSTRPSFQINVMQPQNSTYLQIQQPQNSNYHQIQISEAIPPVGNAPNYNADELLNELVTMATKEPNGLTSLITSFDSSLVQAGMDDLLTQLESCNASQEMADVSPWGASEPASPVSSVPPSPVFVSSVPSPVFVSSPVSSVPSPVPSVGSLSPQSTGGDRSFHQQTPTHTIDDTAIQPEYGKEASSSFLSLLSPSTDDSSFLSVPSPSLIDDDDDESESEYSRSEMHSYSRSPRKSKSSRKTSSSLRGTAHPEGRRERKKEQNKQAALRYRQKKKQEDDVLLSEIEVQEERQEKLKAKFSGLKQELTYLKKIMREVLIAKGTLSPDAFKKK